MTLFEKILSARGLRLRADRDVFLHPDYAAVKHDPFLLPDMRAAVDRLKRARDKQEKIVIYGDYDIDGLSATALLLDAFASFGFEQVDAFIPNRFVEGYGMTIGAVDKVKAMGADLIVTVDCGSLCHAEIAYASELGMDTVVTDHHNVAETPPPSIAAVNPKFPGHTYPFRDLCGAGVAFKLVQALQTELEGLPEGYEKWLLDLVALGTVCDIVTLEDENRANVYWGLEVLKKQRRTGLKALMAVSGVEPKTVNARSLGFGLGPRMNAAGRLETAQHALDMLVAADGETALTASERLEMLNQKRRGIQDEIFEQACEQAEQLLGYPVLVVNAPDSNHGVLGIVASKLVERYKRPTCIIGEHGDSELPLWSTAMVGNSAIDNFYKLSSKNKKNIFNKAKNAAYAIIEGKQATYYAIAAGIVQISKAILFDKKTVFTVSHPLNGEFGIKGVSLSLPAVIGRHGILRRVNMEISAEEKRLLQASASKLKMAEKDLK